MPEAPPLIAAALPGPALMHTGTGACPKPALLLLTRCKRGAADIMLCSLHTSWSANWERMPCLCRYAALSAQQNSEEAIDIVLIESYSGAGTMWKGKKQYKYTPFNPNDKCTVSYVLEEQSGKKYKLLKGAPQVHLQPSGVELVAASAFQTLNPKP